MADYEALQRQLKQKEAEVEQLEDALEAGRTEAEELEEKISDATPLEVKINDRQRDVNFFFYIGLPAAALTTLLLYAHGTAPADNFSAKAWPFFYAMMSWAVTAMGAAGVSINYFDIRRYLRQAQQAQPA